MEHVRIKINVGVLVIRRVSPLLGHPVVAVKGSFSVSQCDDQLLRRVPQSKSPPDTFGLSSFLSNVCGDVMHCPLYFLLVGDAAAALASRLPSFNPSVGPDCGEFAQRLRLLCGD